MALLLTHWGHVRTVQGVLRAGERGDERGAGGDGAAVPGGLVLERGLGRLPGQHRQSVTRSHYGHYGHYGHYHLGRQAAEVRGPRQEEESEG